MNNIERIDELIKNNNIEELRKLEAYKIDGYLSNVSDSKRYTLLQLLDEYYYFLYHFEDKDLLLQFILSKKGTPKFQKSLVDYFERYADDNTIIKYLDEVENVNLKYAIQAIKDSFLAISILQERLNDAADYSILKIAAKFDNNIDKLKCIKYFSNDYYKCELLKLLDDDNLIIENINVIESDFYRNELLCSFDNDEILLKYLKTCPVSLYIGIVKGIKDERIKVSLLPMLSISEQVDIICVLKNEELKKKCVLNPIYSDYRSRLICSVSDKEFIKQFFIDNPNDKLRYRIIDRICDDEFKKELIMVLEDSAYRQVLLSNYKSVRERLLADTPIKSIKQDIDHDITFGVELEGCNVNCQEIKQLDHVLSNWDIKNDGSVNFGVEISSPILRYDEDSLKQLYYVCNLMNDMGFYTDSSCGGHIHLGFDYIKSIKEMKTLLELYGNTEDLLYIICNRAGSTIRKGARSYAKHIDSKLGHIKNVNLDRIGELGEYVSIVKQQQGTRYYGLNLLNANSNYKNTIEFRLPNGEIEFDELLANVRLFMKLLEKSRAIANNNDVRLDYLMSRLYDKDLKEKDRLEILLDILFDSEEDKNIYRERYDKNTSAIRKLVNHKQKVIRL